MLKFASGPVGPVSPPSESGAVRVHRRTVVAFGVLDVHQRRGIACPEQCTYFTHSPCVLSPDDPSKEFCA